jgi:DNA modification methylase
MNDAPFGPTNPHPLSRVKTELVWEGKYDEHGRKREVSLPSFPLVMQRIETIDEPRDRSRAQGSLFDDTTAHKDDFRNRLIWGDNKLAMSALVREFRGRVKLVYVDPPFDVGADFTMDVPLGDGEDDITKEQSVIEAVAYRDTWGKGTDGYLSVIFDRIRLIYELLAEDGSIYVHCGWQVAAEIKHLLNEVFGKEAFQNEITWKRSASRAHVYSRYPSSHETIFFYKKSPSATWNPQYIPYEKSYLDKHYRHVDKDGRRYTLSDLNNPNPNRPTLTYEFAGHLKVWRYTKERMEQLASEGRIFIPQDGGVPRYKRYLDELEGVPVTSVWTDITHVNSQAYEDTSYATQKPEALLERIIRACSNPDDIVADFFCGSGTTLAVAEKLGRRWIGVDLGRYAIHTSRKRLLDVQRSLFAEGTQYRSFDVYNLGRYERQWWQLERLNGANEEHRATVLQFFRAQQLAHSPSSLLHGAKGGAFVHVDDIDSLLTIDELEKVAMAVSEAGGRSLICLAWEFQMDLKVKAQALEAALGLTISLKYIPREIMEPNRTEVQFFEAGALEAEAVVRLDANEKMVDIRLTRFIPSLSEVPERELEELRARAVRSPFDFIDFWAIDFEHKEDKPFEHHWQDYRTRKDRKLLTESNCGWKYGSPGKKLIRIKVIDVFGVDTTKVIEARV